VVPGDNVLEVRFPNVSDNQVHISYPAYLQLTDTSDNHEEEVWSDPTLSSLHFREIGDSQTDWYCYFEGAWNNNVWIGDNDTYWGPAIRQLTFVNSGGGHHTCVANTWTIESAIFGDSVDDGNYIIVRLE